MRQLLRRSIISLVVLMLSPGCERSSEHGEILWIEEKANSAFAVKVTSFREKRDFGQVLAGANYVFETKKREERSWRKFMVLSHDDPVPIDKNSIVLIKENIGYVFMLRKFAVTTDGGTKWSIWDAGEVQSLKFEPDCRIQRVQVREDGAGKMDVTCNKGESAVFTNDYGVTWRTS